MADSVTPWTAARQAPLPVGFSRQGRQSGLLCPPPGDLPDPGLNLRLLSLLHRQAGSLPQALPGKPVWSPGPLTFLEEFDELRPPLPPW